MVSDDMDITPAIVLSDDLVRWICEYHDAGEPAGKIAAELAVPERQVIALLATHRPVRDAQ
jgi:hypothetical protein